MKIVLSFVWVFAIALANQGVVGEVEMEDEMVEVEMEVEMTNATEAYDDWLGDYTVPDANATDVPVEVPTESVAPSPAPTFQEGDAPVVFLASDIDQPLFEAPVEPPPISESGRTTGTTLAAATTVVAIFLAAAW
jgi:hypothetical protein